ncbi:MAG: 4Fe-4S binding protein [Desulfovibrio sp.]|uniref:4Fe-4S binding protein n=1 Tax=Desulfovibrio sp. 7SRBS1 TaxID=3378064 RepID=UPI003B3EDB9E
MGTTARLNIGEGGAMGAVRDFLATLLEKGEAQSILVPRHGGNTVMPSLVTDPSALQSADPFSPYYPLNAAKLVARLTNGETDGMGVAVLRPCEIRAFVELVKLNQGSMENVLLIGVDCMGAVENMQYPVWLNGRNPEEASREFLASGGGDTQLAKACKACEHPVPEEADLIIGTLGADMGDCLPLVAKTPRGEGLINRLGLPDAGDQSARNNAVQQLIEERTAFRDAMFAETSQAVESMPKLADYLSSCINCYNCRVACPVCYCKECVFVTDVFDHKPWQYQTWAQTRGAIRMPTDTLFYHMTRLAHMSASCVGCGQCSNACPNNVPVMELFRTVAHGVQNAFDYQAGRSLEEPPPLTVFQEKEFAEVTGGMVD